MSFGIWFNQSKDLSALFGPSLAFGGHIRSLRLNPPSQNNPKRGIFCYLSQCLLHVNGDDGGDDGGGDAGDDGGDDGGGDGGDDGDADNDADGGEDIYIGWHQYAGATTGERSFIYCDDNDVMIWVRSDGMSEVWNSGRVVVASVWQNVPKV